MSVASAVEQEFFSAALNRAEKEYPLFEKYWIEGISWLILRDPRRGVRVPDENNERYVWSFRKWNPGKIPALLVVYRILSSGAVEFERLTIKS